VLLLGATVMHILRCQSLAAKPVHGSNHLCAELGCGWQRSMQYLYAGNALELRRHLKHFQQLLPAEALCSW
jgi:hypothetical protein